MKVYAVKYLLTILLHCHTLQHKQQNQNGLLIIDVIPRHVSPVLFLTHLMAQIVFAIEA